MLEKLVVLFAIALVLAILLSGRAAREAVEEQRKRRESAFKTTFTTEAPRAKDEREILQKHVDARLEHLALIWWEADAEAAKAKGRYEILKGNRLPSSGGATEMILPDPEIEIAELRLAREEAHIKALIAFEKAEAFFQARNLADQLRFDVREENLDEYLPKDKRTS